MEEKIENKNFKRKNYNEASDKDKNMKICYSSDVSEPESSLEDHAMNSQTVKEEYIDEKIDESTYKSNSDIGTSSNGPEEFLMKKKNIQKKTFMNHGTREIRIRRIFDLKN